MFQQQIDGRAWRYGQTEEVLVYRMVALGTTDVTMSSMANDKMSFLGALTKQAKDHLLEEVLREMDDEDLQQKYADSDLEDEEADTVVIRKKGTKASSKSGRKGKAKQQIEAEIAEDEMGMRYDGGPTEESSTKKGKAKAEVRQLKASRAKKTYGKTKDTDNGERNAAQAGPSSTTEKGKADSGMNTSGQVTVDKGDANDSAVQLTTPKPDIRAVEPVEPRDDAAWLGYDGGPTEESSTKKGNAKAEVRQLKASRAKITYGKTKDTDNGERNAAQSTRGDHYAGPSSTTEKDKADSGMNTPGQVTVDKGIP